MPEDKTTEAWERIRAYLERGDAEELDSFFDTITPAEVARAISFLNEEDRNRVLTVLDPEDAADLLEELTDRQGADLLDDLPAEDAAAIIDVMESDERADVLQELESSEIEAILREMNPEEAEEARRLLSYAEDTAGGLMVTEYVCFSQDMRVRDVLEDMRAHAEQYSDYGVQYIYILSTNQTLIGVVRLRDLVLSPGDSPITKIMIPNPLYAQVTTTLEELQQLFDRYAFVGLPVVDDSGHMAGVVRRSDVEEAQSERAEEALMRFGGIIGGEELRSMPVLSRSVRRLSWLTVNLLLSLAAASVILLFQDTVESYIALAFFIPVIGNMSGCSGNQAVAVSIRELSLGLIQPQDFLRVLSKESQIGLINGVVLGSLVGLIAFAGTHNVAFSLVVGFALAMNTLVALALGGLVPLLLRRARMDPALAAPLAVTTLADMCGFFLMLSLATFAVSHLLR